MGTTLAAPACCDCSTDVRPLLIALPPTPIAACACGSEGPPLRPEGRLCRGEAQPQRHQAGDGAHGCAAEDGVREYTRMHGAWGGGGGGAWGGACWSQRSQSSAMHVMHACKHPPDCTTMRTDACMHAPSSMQSTTTAHRALPSRMSWLDAMTRAR